MIIIDKADTRRLQDKKLVGCLCWALLFLLGFVLVGLLCCALLGLLVVLCCGWASLVFWASGLGIKLASGKS
jgi:hypothetical protein